MRTTQQRPEYARKREEVINPRQSQHANVKGD